MSLRELLARRAFMLHLRWAWDLAYGAALALGMSIARVASLWVGIGTIVVGVVTLGYAVRGK